MVVHVVPLVLLYAVIVEPTRVSLTHTFGAVPVPLLVLLVVPPVLVRRIQRKPPLPVTPGKAFLDPVARVSRIITPTRAAVPVFWNDGMRATISPSALSV